MEKKTTLTSKKLILIIAVVSLVAFASLGVLAYALNKTNKVATTDSYEYENPDPVKAQPDEGIIIDGVLDEAQYQKSNWLYLHNHEDGADVDIAMTSYYGDNGMYFVYDVTEGTPIYVNPDRSSYLNSCVEMYLALSDVTNIKSNSVFEIDMLPTGDLNFKQRTARGKFMNVHSTNDIMAQLGTTTKGGDVNTSECYGYCFELFIPWAYMEKLGMNSSAMKDDYVYVNPAHITSFNYAGDDSKVDRYWYPFAKQYGGGSGYTNISRYFRFDENGLLGGVPVTLNGDQHCTITGDPSIVPGMMGRYTITPEEGYAVNSILVNGEEYIKKVSYNEDGSITFNVVGRKKGLTISATTEKVTEGNKTLTGVVQLNKMSNDNLDGVTVTYKGPQGEKPVTLDSQGRFVLADLKQGYYVITVEKEGYDRLVRGIYLNRDIDTELSLEYPIFEVQSGHNWVLYEQNDGVLHRFGGTGKIRTTDSYDKFTFDVNLKYDKELAKQSDGDNYLQQRSGMKIKFSNGKLWGVHLLQQDGEYIVQYQKAGSDSLFGWTTVYTLNKKDIKKYQSEEGIKLSMVRNGQYAYIYLDNTPIAVEELGAEYANCTAQLFLEAWVANQEAQEIKYNISRTANVDINKIHFRRVGKWDISRYSENILILPNGGRAGALEFYKKYVNMDLTMKVRDYDDPKNTAARTDVLLVFENGAHISFGVNFNGKKVAVQSMNRGANDGKQIYNRWKNWAYLTDEETELYNTEGIDFRIVRIGTEIALYIGDRFIGVCDLTNNNSGVTADMKATVSLRHYDDEGVQVEIPLEITDTPKSGTFKEVIFAANADWDLSEQNQSYVIDKDGYMSASGVVALPKGGKYTVDLYNKYTNIDFSVVATNYDEADQNSRTDITLYFDTNGDGKYNDTLISVGVVISGTGVATVQSATKGITKAYHTYGKLTANEEALYKSTGVTLRVVRHGTELYIYIDNRQVGQIVDLTEYAKGTTNAGMSTGITADTKALVTLRHWGDVREDGVRIPYALTTKTEKLIVPESIFAKQDSTGVWDLTNESNGVVKVSATGTSNLPFADLYKDIDLTVKMKENGTRDPEGKITKYGRTDILFEFYSDDDAERDEVISFGITNNSLELCGLGASYGNVEHIYARWTQFYKLTDEELADYRGDGVELRIVRLNTTVYLFIDGRQVASVDLTAAGTNQVKADTPAKVTLRHYDIKGEFEFPFAVTDKVEKVTLDIADNANGTVTATEIKHFASKKGVVQESSEHFVGETIVLKVAPNEGYACTEFLVNGNDTINELVTNNDGTYSYSFVANEQNYAIEAGYARSTPSLFVENSNWDLTKQYEGEVSLPGGGTASSSKNKGVLKFYDKYTDVDLTLKNVKENGTGSTHGRTDVLFEFDTNNDGSIDKSVSFGTVVDGYGKSVVQAMGNSGNYIMTKRPLHLFELSESETEKYLEGEGVELRLVRLGTNVYIYVEGTQRYVFDLAQNDSGVTATTEATISFRHYDAVVENGSVVFRFEISDTVKSIFEENTNWDVTKQYEGVVSLPGGGTASSSKNKGVLKFHDKYTNIDLTLKNVKENGTGNTHGRTDVLFEFDTNNDGSIDKSVSFGTVVDGNGKSVVQAMGNSGNYIMTKRPLHLFELSESETEKYLEGEGVELRLVRLGTNVYIYVEGTQRYVFDLTQNDSGVTATTEATISFRHYDAVVENGSVVFQFKVSDKIKEVTLDIASNANGVITTNEISTKHFMGETIVLKVTPNEGYSCTEFLVNGNDTINELVTNNDGTYSYSFVANEQNYAIEAGYTGSTQSLFVENSNWDLTKQYEGEVSLPGGGTASSSKNKGVLKFYNQYTDVDLTLKNVKEYGTGSTHGRTDVLFEFDTNNDGSIDKSISFGITVDGNGKYVVQTLGNSGNYIPTKRNNTLYELSESEIAKYSSGEGVELRLVRLGTNVYIYVEGSQRAVFDLTQNNSGVTATTKATISFRHYDAVVENGSVVFRFEISDTVKSIFEENTNWDVTKQYAGEVSLPGGGTASSSKNKGVLKFSDKYTDVDLTLKNVKEYGTGSTHGRTDVLFEFDTNNDGSIDKSISFGITVDGNGKYVVQTLGNSGNYIPTKRNNTLYELSESEIAKYSSGEGVELRLVRLGTNVYIYVEGTQRAVFDLTQNNSGVTATTKATISFRHYDAVVENGSVVFRFEISHASANSLEVATAALPLATKYTDADFILKYKLYTS